MQVICIWENEIKTGLPLRMKNRIKVYRALRNLTQEALAEQLGVTRQTILAIEKEKYDPSL
jgi:putative transcriptional regulator